VSLYTSCRLSAAVSEGRYQKFRAKDASVGDCLQEEDPFFALGAIIKAISLLVLMSTSFSSHRRGFQFVTMVVGKPISPCHTRKLSVNHLTFSLT
jgi:hypothetical protein